MSRKSLLKSSSKHHYTTIFVRGEDGCRIPLRVRTSVHMDTAADGLENVERRISVEAAARYAHNTLPAPVHTTPPPIPARSPTRPQPPLPVRGRAPIREPPVPVREPITRSRSQPPPLLREPPPPREIITLDQVRSGPRATNDYVDSPQWAAFRARQNNKSTLPLSSTVGHKSLHTPSGLLDRTVGDHSLTGVGSRGSHDHVISSQPQSLGLKKERVIPTEEPPPPCQDSIICSQCGKCRCGPCTQPRELPRRWLCNNKVECSVQKMVDVCSCLCCVRACFYHCFKDSEGDECSASDDPCACCERPDCCKRWTCLGLMSLCLPCLCLYWPLRCGLICCTSVYNRCSQRGCHCRRDRQPGSKRLLIDSESSST